MPGTIKSELLSYADRITKCERQEKGRGGPQGNRPSQFSAGFVFFYDRIWQDFRRGLMYGKHCQEERNRDTA